MKLLFALPLAVVIAACASSPPDAPVIPASPAPPWSPAPPIASSPSSPLPECGPPPPSPQGLKATSCESYTLKDGQSFHDQLRVELAPKSSAQMDCPRMRYRGQDTPFCVTKSVGGAVHGACCPPGHSDPDDPECTSEGFLHQMFGRNKVWEWCEKGRLPSDPCQPCVWTTNAQR